MDYSDYNEMFDKVNYNHFKIKYDEAWNRSIEFNKDKRAKKTNARNIKIKKQKRALVIGAIACATTISIFAVSPVAKRQHMINKAIDYQKQEIAIMLQNGQTNFSKDQMLGLMALKGDEIGVELVTGQNWKEYCTNAGYTEVVHISENGTYVENEPSMRVLKNHLEAEAIERMIENTDENGNYIFPSVDNTEDIENVNDGGKII